MFCYYLARMHSLFRSLLSQDRILGGAAVLAVTQFGASLCGFLRDRILAQTFPELGITDIYVAAFRPSDLLFQMTIMAGFSVALVPLLARYKAKKDTNEMSRLLSGVLGIAALAFGCIALLSAVFFEQIAPLIVRFKGESLQLYVQFGRIALLTNFLFVFGNAFGQYLITVQRYWVYGFTPILYTLGTIGGTVFLTPLIGPYGPIIGTLIGACMYVVLRIAAAIRQGFYYHATLWHPDVAEMGTLMFPRVLALGALQLQLLLFDTAASAMSTGSVTINAYARNVQSAAVGLIGIALAQSVFSLLSQSAAGRDTKRFWLYLKRGVGMIVLFTVPAALSAVLLAPVAGWLFSFGGATLSLFTVCLSLYALSIPFESLNHLLLRAFYALKETRVPAIFSVLNGVTAIWLAWYLSPYYGIYSLGIAFSAGQIIQLVGLSVCLRIRTINN